MDMKIFLYNNTHLCEMMLMFSRLIVPYFMFNIFSLNQLVSKIILFR